LPATRAFFAEARRLRFDLAQKLHAYVYMRWIYQYIAIGLGEHRWSGAIGRLARFGKRRSASDATTAEPPRAMPGRPAAASPTHEAIAQGYHGKVTRLGDARALVTLDKPISLMVSEQVLPYENAREIVLRNPDHIVALDCPCRAARDNPCMPLDVCLIVGEPFASGVMEHHPDRAKWISQTRAVEILEQEHERGHVHHAFFKDVMLERFYAICNCCSCCCGAMQAYRNGTPMLASSGYVSQVDAEACIDCGTCEEICPFDAVVMTEMGEPVVDRDTCMGCGVCVDACPEHAHELVLDPSKGDPLEITTLVAGCPAVDLGAGCALPR
jgi:ferredoxin